MFRNRMLSQPRRIASAQTDSRAIARSLSFILALATFLAFTGSSAAAQGGGNQAQGAGDGDFTVYLESPRVPPGNRLYGLVDPGVTPAAMDFYSELQPQGGLHRTNVRMDVLPNRAGNAA